MSVELPPEIHGEIVSHILPDEETSERDCTATLATLRLVSKSFHSSATPSLFATYRVYSQYDYSKHSRNRFLYDLYKKDIAALALAPFVKHVVIIGPIRCGHVPALEMPRIYLQSIQNMPNLVKVCLSHTFIKSEHVEWLATLPALQNLSLHACEFFISWYDEIILQTLTTICRRTLKEYGLRDDYFSDPVFSILTSENTPLTTLEFDNPDDINVPFFDLLESLPSTIVNLTINHHFEILDITPPLRVLSPNSMPNLRFLKCPPQMLPMFTGNHLESLRSLDLTGLYAGPSQPNVTINPFSVILTSLEELTMSLDDFLSFNTESQTTFAANLPRLNTLIADGAFCEFESGDHHDFDNHIDRLIASFSPPNEVRELRFPVLGCFPDVNLLLEREMIVKIVKGPFPKLRKVAFSHHVTWVKDSVMRVARAEESDKKVRLDDWRPFIPRRLITESPSLLDESIVNQVSDYIQVQMEAESGFTSLYDSY